MLLLAASSLILPKIVLRAHVSSTKLGAERLFVVEAFLNDFFYVKHLGGFLVAPVLRLGDCKATSSHIRGAVLSTFKKVCY